MHASTLLRSSSFASNHHVALPLYRSKSRYPLYLGVARHCTTFATPRLTFPIALSDRLGHLARRNRRQQTLRLFLHIKAYACGSELGGIERRLPACACGIFWLALE
ncbi:hypothetical protein B0H19DRAFT_1368220 [Mycena capillaripes]|nr:hypothetical protein B0H19DRAFT_1368220 [Mycena capillaripes]